MWKEYINATTIDEVLQALSERGESARIVAGATDLILELERGVRRGIDTLIDVTRIPNFPVGTVPAAAGVRPSAYPLKTTDFFVQGITFSLMWTF